MPLSESTKASSVSFIMAHLLFAGDFSNQLSAKPINERFVFTHNTQNIFVPFSRVFCFLSILLNIGVGGIFSLIKFFHNGLDVACGYCACFVCNGTLAKARRQRELMSLG